MAGIIKISPDTWAIEDNGVRFFLLEGCGSALLYRFDHAGFYCDLR